MHDYPFEENGEEPYNTINSVANPSIQKSSMRNYNASVTMPING